MSWSQGCLGIHHFEMLFFCYDVWKVLPPAKRMYWVMLVQPRRRNRRWIIRDFVDRQYCTLAAFLPHTRSLASFAITSEAQDWVDNGQNEQLCEQLVMLSHLRANIGEGGWEIFLLWLTSCGNLAYSPSKLSLSLSPSLFHACNVRTLAEVVRS